MHDFWTKQLVYVIKWGERRRLLAALPTQFHALNLPTSTPRKLLGKMAYRLKQFGLAAMIVATVGFAPAVASAQSGDAKSGDQKAATQATDPGKDNKRT
ncbi:MAG: hypothetical protein J0H62_05030, partial [Rhizobiales bacterium]|nr:hypothetical protein [Hyphomicrobiales bacterium]